MRSVIKTLVVMAAERQSPLLERLEGCAEVTTAANCHQARRVLRTRRPVNVVLTDAALPDGDWRTVLREVSRADRNVKVVVCTRLPDVSLWREALAEGAYDLLVEPYERREVCRIVEKAAA